LEDAKLEGGDGVVGARILLALWDLHTAERAQRQVAAATAVVVVHNVAVATAV
jgi:hypothetical protein